MQLLMSAPVPYGSLGFTTLLRLDAEVGPAIPVEDCLPVHRHWPKHDGFYRVLLAYKEPKWAQRFWVAFQ